MKGIGGKIVDKGIRGKRRQKDICGKRVDEGYLIKENEGDLRSKSR